MFGNHYHWQRRSWFARMGVDPMLATVVALLGGVALGYGVALAYQVAPRFTSRAQCQQACYIGYLRRPTS
jgi:hypothetical protein